MYYLVYLFSTESWLRSTTTTKRETRIEEKKKKYEKRKKMKREEYTRRKETRNIHTHTHTRARAQYTRENETEESSRRCELARSVVTLQRISTQRRSHVAISTLVTPFSFAYTHLHAYTDTRTTHVYTYVRYIHTEREERSVKAGRHCSSHTRTHIYK